jgi:HD-GYP domain-containing protein (c-di-GMP phosphodiesterase class II)
MSCHEALEECRRNAGSQFWPEAVRALEALVGAGALGDAGPGPLSGDAVAARP